MDYFLTKYHESCKKAFKEYNFKRKSSNNYVRVVNDVMQNFYLFRSWSGTFCRISFCVTPLCFPIQKYHVSTGGPTGYELSNLDGIKRDEWGYTRTQSSMDICISELVEYMKNKLMPFFKKADSCKTALYELCELEKIYNGKIDVYDLNKFYFALKADDYNFALKILYSLLHAREEYLVDFNGYRGEGWEKPVLDEISRYREYISLVERKDTQGINQLIRKNEEFSINNLKGIIKKSDIHVDNI